MNWEDTIPADLFKKYEMHNFNNAIQIMSSAYPDDFQQILSALSDFSFTLEDVIKSGGNESAIPKKYSALMYPNGWDERNITGDLIVRLAKKSGQVVSEKTISDFIGGHNIDYIKGDLAIDFEWNSKDQTFDRDLYAIRSFYECGIIAAAVIITRSESLNHVFARLGIKQKYGASTTWMGKLLPRIFARRHGGCPLFVVGIKPAVISDWEE